MSWKPNKAGQYLYSGQCYDLESFSVTHNFEIIRGSGSRVLPPTTMTLQEQIASMDGPWSLLSPDWQDGAPTVEQLKRWQWWAVMHDDENLYCGKAKMSVAYFYIGNAVIDREFIGKSAPIQPDLSNGPLWVPLEVVVEKT